MTPRGVLLVLAAASAAGVVWAAVLIVFLLAGVRPLPLAVAALVTIVLIVPGFVAAVRSSASRSRTRRGRQADLWRLVEHLPDWVLGPAAVFFVAFWLTAGLSFPTMGNAEIRDGQYVANNHGQLTVIDKATYDRQVAAEERFFLGVLGAFGVAGATLCAAAANRHRDKR
jgi:hypothetical protein